MTIWVPRCLDMIMVSSRATLSVGPPAENGTTADTGLLPGYSSACAPGVTTPDRPPARPPPSVQLVSSSLLDTLLFPSTVWRPAGFAGRVPAAARGGPPVPRGAADPASPGVTRGNAPAPGWAERNAINCRHPDTLVLTRSLAVAAGLWRRGGRLLVERKTGDMRNKRHKTGRRGAAPGAWPPGAPACRRRKPPQRKKASISPASASAASSGT